MILATTGDLGVYYTIVSNVEEIERAISALPRDKFFRLRDWIRERFADEWDRQFEEDVEAGRLDEAAGKALVEHRAGESVPFPDDEESCGP